MKVALFTNIVSPHLLPFAKALIGHLGEECVTYLYTEAFHGERTKMGWADLSDVTWCRHGDKQDEALYTADVVVSGLRGLDLFEARNSARLQTYYASERWFKPSLGFLRLCIPSYFKMARRFVRCVKSPYFMLLPQGIHAARDFLRLLGMFAGDVRCLFSSPKVAFESQPGGVVVPLKAAKQAGVLSREEVRFAKRYGFVQIPQEYWGRVKPEGMYAKMRLWGYFVAPCNVGEPQTPHSECAHSVRGVGGYSLPIQHSPKVLWVGRMLNLKRVDTLVRACRPHPNLKRVDTVASSLHLALYGDGPEKSKLMRLAEKVNKVQSTVTFHDFVPIEQVRGLMRTHDVYVLPSNGFEGWGAVVSEALEEGMRVLGTIDAGSTATILPSSHLFKSGDVKRLAQLLRGEIAPLGIGVWRAENAAQAFLALVQEMQGEP